MARECKNEGLFAGYATKHKDGSMVKQVFTPKGAVKYTFRLRQEFKKKDGTMGNNSFFIQAWGKTGEGAANVTENQFIEVKYHLQNSSFPDKQNPGKMIFRQDISAYDIKIFTD